MLLLCLLCRSVLVDIRAANVVNNRNFERFQRPQLICQNKCSIYRQQIKKVENRGVSVDPIRFHTFELDRVWVIFVMHSLEYNSARSITPSVIIDLGVMLLEIHNDISIVYGSSARGIKCIRVLGLSPERDPSDCLTDGTRSLNLYQIWAAFSQYQQKMCSASTRYSQGPGYSSWNPDVLPSGSESTWYQRKRNKNRSRSILFGSILPNNIDLLLFLLQKKKQKQVNIVWEYSCCLLR